MSNTDLSRTDLLQWINNLLDLNYTRIEQLGNGAAYCQIIDSIYGDVPMQKIKFDTILDYEIIQNYKILQNSFLQHRIQKPIPIERLAKMKFQDNFEFTQWFKRFFDIHPPTREYNPSERRKLCSEGIVSSIKLSKLKESRSRSNSNISDAKLFGRPKSINSANRPSNHSAQILEVLKHQIQKLQQVNQALEKERNFYYQKLRDVEIEVQECEQNDPNNLLLKKIQSILYKVEDGFEIPQDPEIDNETF
ncbi:Microtubule-associated Mapre1-like protein [Rozella allomycis CSF55]|uniref:Microtubule-associated Mapre1-like protein n=1 Tax=Rozella allomycis (strain CSF55) TaxID=988480 RepID=A0A075AQR4_ROZAC|nr:Microtubule-associated Mapre1-like protein [Rozella allomycis CSF55]|eukprot:EPZ32520.1 Microtubule-associated Mapre1-like protein [Rozella allomycis CSF55]